MATTSQTDGGAGRAVAALITLVCVGWPLGSVLWAVVAGVMAGDISKPAEGLQIEPALRMAPAWGLLGSTIAWGLVIGVLATALAWPGAWLIRRRGWRVLPLMLVPLLLPSYLAYSGYSTLRAAGTPGGDWLAGLVDSGLPEAPALAGRVLAMAGLSLWAWPISAIVLGATFRRLDEPVLEALRLDAPPLRRLLQVLSMSRVGVISSIALVALVMMGSAVPLHLAQVPTYAIKVWLDLTLAPGRWRVWLAAWPLLVFACGGAFIIAAAIARQAGRPDEAVVRAEKRGGAAGAVAVWLVAVALPVGLFVWTASDLRPYRQFWAASADPVATSAGIGAMVGGLGVVLAAAFWQGMSAARVGGPGVLLRACLVLLLLMGLLPGVLVGSAVSTAINITPGAYELGESPLAVVVAHAGRFGFLAALVGCWLAAVEPRQERDLRALDAGLGLRSWWAVCLPVQGGALAGAGLAMAALSLHEIEAAVMVQPPGSPSLAQVMLNHLHQLRMQDVAAAAVVVVLMGLVVAGLAAWSARRTIRRVV